MSVAPLLISAADREAFKRCRREWDLGSRTREGYELLARVSAPPPDVTRCLFGALAVYYFPGMWEWDRNIVKPLVLKAWSTSIPGDGRLQQFGEAIIDGYFDWAPSVDGFTPLRVETDFAVNIPDPVISDRDLSTYDGDELRYVGRVDVVVVDDDSRFWIVEHRAGWSDPELLALDEAALTKCWAWSSFYLGEEIEGTIFNEVRLDDQTSDRFRRTVVPRSAESRELARRQLGREALLMFDESLIAFPSPSALHCSGCEYRAPCIAMYAGLPPHPILEVHYRRREPDAPVEGRLGGASWSVGRGARPRHFDARDQSSA